MTIRRTSSRLQPHPLATRLLIGGFASLITLLPTAASAEHQVADEHEVHFDSATEKQIGKETLHELSQFFHDAEIALETEDMDAIMALYSDGYANGPHNKASLIPIWKRIFRDFDNLYTKHNMRVVTESGDSPVMIIRCSGILMGTPKGESNAVAIALDYWINNDHILVKEKGTWRLVGTTGKEQKRFGFDTPIHPLF
ncbi:MAG: hypothetical protein HQK87_00505 [Nitrospinae bacterium]|nr:hypothetical protein [Nitrospinota bacterium]